MLKKSITWAFLVPLLLASPLVHAITLTFDEPVFTHGTVVGDSQSNPTISTIYDSAAFGHVTIFADNIGGGPDLAVTFDTSLSSTLDPDLEDPFANVNNPLLGPQNPGNVLIIQENSTGCGDGTCDAPDDEGTRAAGHLLFEFANPVELVSLDFFDIETTAENNGIAGSEIRFYDQFGSEMFTHLFTPGTGGDNTWDRLFFAGITGIYGLEVNLYGSGAIDNLVFSVVPLPASVWLFGTALLGFIGYSRRRSI